MSDTQVNITTDLTQSRVLVAMNEAGQRVVAWTSQVPLTGGGTAPHFVAQIYDANGAPSGSELDLLNLSGSPSSSPSIAMDAEGNFIVAWTQANASSGSSVQAQRFHSDGTADGTPVLVASGAANYGPDPSVSMSEDGDFAVAWQQSRTVFNSAMGMTETIKEIFVGSYGADGTATASPVVAAQSVINPMSQMYGSVGNPQVALSEGGSFIVAWDLSGPMISGSFHGAYFASPTAGPQNLFVKEIHAPWGVQASLASNTNGDVVVTWNEAWPDATPLFAQTFSADGSPKSGPVMVAGQPGVYTPFPSHADIDAAGNFVVTWQGSDSDGTGIYSRIYASSGQPKSEVTLVNTVLAGNQMAPAVAMDGDGNFVVAWDGPDGSGQGVFLKTFNADGSLQGSLTVTDEHIALSGASGVGGAYKIGDVVTVSWDNSAAGDANGTEISKVTFDFSAFGGGSAVEATQGEDGAWRATYTILAGGLEASDLSVSMTVTDIEDNTVTVADGAKVSLDAVAPTLASIALQSPQEGATNADSLTWHVTFDGAAAHVDAADFVVSGTTATVTNVTPLGGDVYAVTVSGGNLAGVTGTVSLALATAHNIADAAGNPLANVVPTGGNASYELDNTPPTVPVIDGLSEGPGGLVLSGTGETGSTVVLRPLGGGAELATVPVVDGRWSTVLGEISLTAGLNSFEILARDALGNTSAVATGIAQYQKSVDAAQLAGGTGNDVLLGNISDDTLAGGAGADRLDGAGGTDLADYSASVAGVQVSLATGMGAGGDAEGDVLSRIENLRGSEQGDSLTGDAAANRLEGVGGDDALQGGAGDDLLDGGLGRNTLDGGAGLDTVDYSASSSGVAVDLSQGQASSLNGDRVDTLTSIEVVQGSAYNDTMMGSSGTDILSGGEGDDVFGASAGADVIDGGDGFDTVVYGTGLEGPGEGVVVSLDPMIESEGAAAGQTLISIEGLVGTGGDDWLIGDVSGMNGWDRGSYGYQDNLLAGRGGDDTLDGGFGDDTLMGGAGSDLLIGGEGEDTADFSDLNGAVTVRLDQDYATSGNDRDDLISIENVVGTASDDLIIGDAEDNRLEGGAGNDTLEGGAGGDWLVGGEGRDMASYAHATRGVTAALTSMPPPRLAGEVSVNYYVSSPNTGDAQYDTYESIEDLEGSAQADALYGNGESNLIRGLAGNDALYGGDGDDTLEGGLGADALNGGAGFDIASYERAASGVQASLAARRNPLDGGAQDEARQDTYVSVEGLRGSAKFADKLVGNDGDNLLQGLGGADTLDGGAGNDTLEGGDGADLLLGGAGNDTLIGGAGMDTMIGGEGIDTADFSSTASGLTVDLARGFAGRISAGDTLSGIENVIGTAFNDTLIGDAADNLLQGGAGNDTLTGGLGADTLDGGEGVDTVSYAAETSGIALDLENATLNAGAAAGDVLISIENLTGSAGNDVLRGNGADNLLDGGAGDDLIEGRGGQDRLIGGAGNDTVTYAGRSGTVVIDLAAGSAATNTGFDSLSGFENATGSNGADWIAGDAAANRLMGGAGADSLFGREGDDALDGGAGSNRLDGGAGNDTVDYAAAEEATAFVSFATRSGEVERYSPFAIGGASALLGSDTLIGIETLKATAGTDDMIDGSGETDRAMAVDLGAGTLSLTGASSLTMTVAGFEHALGGALADTLTGSAGSNILSGGAGNDTLTGGAGADILAGGDDIDTADYSSSLAAVTVDLATGSGSGGDAEGDMLVEIENVIGTAQNDVLTGDNLANRLAGGAGNDTLSGGAGADTLEGGTGDDVFLIGAAEFAAGETINGGAGQDVIRFTATTATTLVLNAAVSGVEEVRLSDAAGNTGGTVAGNLDAAALAAAVKITLTGNDGANRLVGNDDGASVLHGNGGADLLIGGAGADTLDGGADDDRLEGGNGNDLLLGGAGNDTLIGGLGMDTMIGGEGIDTADFGSTASGLTVDLARGYAGRVSAGDSLSGIENVIGTAFNDTLIGDAGANLLQGGAGNDTLTGGLGADTLDGGEGVDTVSYAAETSGIVLDLENAAANTGAAAGDMFISIESFVGSAGNDVLRGNGAANLLDGGAGDDLIEGRGGNDTLIGGAGQDVFLLHTASDLAQTLISGGEGWDVLRYTAAGTLVLTAGVTGVEEVRISDADGNTSGTAAASLDATALGAGSSITLTGNNGANLLVGNDDGTNILVGHGGADTLIGGAGSDTLIGGEGADRLIGGDGSDWADYSSSSLAVSVNLKDQVQVLGDAEGDVLIGIENLIGSNGDDFLRGDMGANHLMGGAGNDSVQGHEGNDTLEGGLGADELIGGTGVDVASYRSAASGVVVDMLFSREATGEAEGDTFLGIENLQGSAFGDLLAGDNWANVLWGEAGNDTLIGAGGADTLIGGAGSDTLTGGTGADHFVLVRGDGADTITDFSANQGDVMELRGYGAALDSFGDLLGRFQQAGTDVVIAIGEGDSLTLQNTTIATLTTDHFLFG
jgi:Ca2+-binding RTX toxin-like protein